MEAVTATLFELPEANRPHPARYTDVLLTTFAKMLRGSKRILDPFGGTGKVFLLEHWLLNAQIEAVEIEPEWAAINPRTTLGNALALPWPDNYFDAICTSPTYGNHMADQSTGLTPKSGTITKYRAKIGRQLHHDNSGAMSWGSKYQNFHIAAWIEAMRVLRPGGRFVLNIKDHIRNGERQHVTDWHIKTLLDLGFVLQEHVKIPCPGMRYGQNGNVRIEHESVILFQLEDTWKPD